MARPRIHPAGHPLSRAEKDPKDYLPDGRPSEYRADFHPKEYIRLSKMGKSMTQIACTWDLDRQTLYDWAERHRKFAGALKKGREGMENWYSELGQAAMIGQATFNGQKVKLDVGLYVWLTKNICKWSDRVQNDDTVKVTAETKSTVNFTLPKNGSEKK